MATLREAGKRIPGEAKVIRAFTDYLPDEYIILSNYDFYPGEIDVIVIGGEGIVLVEIKNWWGKVMGNAKEWESLDERGRPVQCHSPLSQEEMKRRQYALKGDLEHKLKPWGLTLHRGKENLRFNILTFVAFPNPEVNLSELPIGPQDRPFVMWPDLFELRNEDFCNRYAAQMSKARSFRKLPPRSLTPAEIRVIAESLFRTNVSEFDRQLKMYLDHADGKNLRQLVFLLAGVLEQAYLVNKPNEHIRFLIEHLFELPYAMATEILYRTFQEVEHPHFNFDGFLEDLVSYGKSRGFLLDLADRFRANSKTESRKEWAAQDRRLSDMLFTFLGFTETPAATAAKTFKEKTELLPDSTAEVETPKNDEIKRDERIAEVSERPTPVSPVVEPRGIAVGYSNLVVVSASGEKIILENERPLLTASDEFFLSSALEAKLQEIATTSSPCTITVPFFYNKTAMAGLDGALQRLGVKNFHFIPESLALFLRFYPDGNKKSRTVLVCSWHGSYLSGEIIRIEQKSLHRVQAAQHQFDDAGFFAAHLDRAIQIMLRLLNKEELHRLLVAGRPELNAPEFRELIFKHLTKSPPQESDPVFDAAVSALSWPEKSKEWTLVNFDFDLR